MIVEDDPYISHFLQMSFEQEGYRILMTTKGHEALSLFYSHQPDIVILDLGLPDIDGLEVIQEIRKISSKPIIVVSARLEEQEKIKALDLGANDYVVKPFYMGELLARIRVAKRLSRKEDEEILSGEIPSPLNPPEGCRFHTRCPYATEECRKKQPEWKDMGNGRFLACHHPLQV